MRLESISAISESEYKVVCEFEKQHMSFIFTIESADGMGLIQCKDGLMELMDDSEGYGLIAEAVGTFARAQRHLRSYPFEHPGK